ncbi:ABC transporter ATP-binding protein [Actinomyces minihominis]|uniref:ABC transporter ATP-binding protein n=1 Tax=Actinomyces minihominis TaxID=2002838 RepID=UPI000C08B975|nr:ATP-binding cassette domain-containing protein [Actinomyces minihominis]
MQPLIDLQGVSLRRGRAEILRDVTFTVNPGENWVILGPNGAGKTTLARLVAARDYPSAGTANVLGSDTSGEEATYLASRVGVASADTRERISASDIVEDVVLSAGWGQTVQFGEEYEDDDRSRARDLLAALGVGELAQRRFGTLSEGERQRVSIARALMPDPEVVILDEPTAGLDLGARETLVMALTEIMAAPKAPAIILITHEIEEISPGFTHAALIKDGTVAAAGPIGEVLTNENLSSAFGLPLEVTNEDGRWWARAR